jgi:hypothetical protein
MQAFEAHLSFSGKKGRFSRWGLMTGVTIWRRKKKCQEECPPRYEKSSRRMGFNKSFPAVPITIRLKLFGFPVARRRDHHTGQRRDADHSIEHNAAGTDDP